MSAAELAQILHARRIGRGKWQAKCPAHPDRNPSLSIAEGRKVPVVLRCMSQGCDTRDILAALGLRWDALFDGKPTPEIQQRVSKEARLASLHRQKGLARWMQVLEPQKRRYWEAVERRIIRDMEPLYWEVMPDLERFERIRRVEVEQYRHRRGDWIARQEQAR